MMVTCGIYLFNGNNKLLIGHPTNHKWTLWSIPKGRVDEGETDYFEVAKREMFEEANINLNDFDISKIVEFDLYRYKSKQRHLKSYFVKVNNGFENHDIKCDSMVIWDGKPVFPEIDKFQWVSIEEARKLLHESQVPNLDRCEKLI